MQQAFSATEQNRAVANGQTVIVDEVSNMITFGNQVQWFYVAKWNSIHTYHLVDTYLSPLTLVRAVALQVFDFTGFS